MKIMSIAPTLVVCGLGFAGCGGDSSSVPAVPAATASTPDPAEAPAATMVEPPAATATPGLDACGLLTADEVLAATGVTMVSSKSGNGETMVRGEIVAVANCTFLSESGSIANVAVYVPGEKVFAQLEEHAPTLKGYAPADGLGVRGFYGGNSYGAGELSVLTAGGQALVMKVQQGEPAKWKEQVTRLATQALARLDG